jgi:hypothetical protein
MRNELLVRQKHIKKKKEKNNPLGSGACNGINVALRMGGPVEMACCRIITQCSAGNGKI